MTEEITKTLDELKGNAHIKKMETHSLPNGVPVVDVWVRKELYRLVFLERKFTINRITKAKVIHRGDFDTYEEFIINVLYCVNDKRKARTPGNKWWEFWRWAIWDSAFWDGLLDGCDDWD